MNVRKWLFEAGDGPSGTLVLPRPTGKRGNEPRRTLIQRRGMRQQKSMVKSASLIDWFYKFFKEVFTVYHRTEPTLDDGSCRQDISSAIASSISCSRCQVEHRYSRNEM